MQKNIKTSEIFGEFARYRFRMAPALNKLLSWRQITRAHQRQLGEKCYKLGHYKKKGFPIPPFFAIPSTLTAEIIKNQEVSGELRDDILGKVAEIETETEKQFGSDSNPLLLIVRSGDPSNMHGALLSIPAIGLNDVTFNALLEIYPGRRGAVHGLYLDLILDFAQQIGKVTQHNLNCLLERAKENNLAISELQRLIKNAKRLVNYYPFKYSFPQNVSDQLMAAVVAVASSWETVEARVAATSIGIDWKKEMPSVFIQEFIDGSLEDAFISMTTPPLFGRYVPKTSGRYVMSGTLEEKNTIKHLEDHDPELFREVMGHADRLVQAEKDPLNIEGVISGRKLEIFQVCGADLSRPFHAKAVEEMLRRGFISQLEADRKIAESVVTSEVKIFRLNPETEFEVIAQASPIMEANESQGQMAMDGKLAMTIYDAFNLKDQGERVIFLSTDPRDEGLYQLLYGKGERVIDGLIATYGIDKLGSHIVDIAKSVGIPIVASLKGARIEPISPPLQMFPMYMFNPILFMIPVRYRVFIGDKKFEGGSHIVIDGSSGRVMVTDHPEPIIEDRTVSRLSYGISPSGLARSMQDLYQTYTYEEVLAEHGRFVGEINNLEGKKGVEKEVGWLQTKTHILHAFAYQKGEREGLSRRQIDLDVAVADGNLNRIPGLEDKNLLLDVDKKNDEVHLVIGTMVEYEYHMIPMGELEEEDVKKLVSVAKKKGLEVEYLFTQKKLSRHTQWVLSYGLKFKRDALGEVVDFLKEYFNS